ncbi:MAG: glycosyltransferase [Candidatus Paceibacterota bacterium]|jgi:dolichyl-phosphate beta-glucosyltransferase|nr:glycosyltransferase [Candidatus Paceibacterota bacterium]MDD3548396.1 glycosyltransferase [Candidatus Paceibacterota bacterium]MDD4998947.1 glycosyltransferase [Candidatus Paceibacterota bacterium]MDD5545078.1 glycosyltransferase [Candidatus Paceibacterota bacterium]
MIKKELSIIIPAYQKEGWIVNTIERLIANFPEGEIIVINDASKDNTKKIKEIFNGRIVYLENEKNEGKGYSLKRGFALAGGDFLIFTDADLPFGIEGIKLILEKLKSGSAVVIGKRRSFYNDKGFKALFRPWLYIFLKFFFGLNYKDTQCGLKGFAKVEGKKLFSLAKTKGFAIDIELLYLAKKLNYGVNEVLVEQKKESYSPSTFNFRRLLEMFFDLIKLKFYSYEKT